MLGHYIGVAIVSLLTGAGVVRTLVYVSKNLAPLPPNAGWWATTAYNLVKGLSGLDPNSTILSQGTLAAMGLKIPEATKP
jgi:hypothetical protein